MGGTAPPILLLTHHARQAPSPGPAGRAARGRAGPVEPAQLRRTDRVRCRAPPVAWPRTGERAAPRRDRARCCCRTAADRRWVARWRAGRGWRAPVPTGPADPTRRAARRQLAGGAARKAWGPGWKAPRELTATPERTDPAASPIHPVAAGAPSRCGRVLRFSAEPSVAVTPGSTADAARARWPGRPRTRRSPGSPFERASPGAGGTSGRRAAEPAPGRPRRCSSPSRA